MATDGSEKAGNLQPLGSLGTGVQLDDFWMMAHKPHLNRDGIYKQTGQDEHAGHLKTEAQLEEEETLRPAPRRVIPVSEVEKFIDHFWKQSQLQKNETKALVDMFFEYARKPKGYMTRSQFKHFIFGTLDIFDPFVCERMFIIFDRNKDGFIDYEEWTHGMHSILVGSIHEQLKYCFLAYDVRGKGHLERDDVYFWLKKSYYNLNPMTETQRTEFFGDIYQLILERFVNGRDNLITFWQYRSAVCENPALMQIIGTVLPDSQVVWRVNDVLFPRFYRSKHLLLFPRGDVPKNRDIKLNPSRLMKRYPETAVCYPPNYKKGPDGKPMLRKEPSAQVVEAVAPVKAGKESIEKPAEGVDAKGKGADAKSGKK
ncbi:putative EF-hand calcium-binding domain-containing protein 1 [Hypsibius exemplaris]|uniref:EF-hand calcium-binding domain-containing protein 1 n=1 Tax=Hypsibius exemplaris TaxID=2072580 RepID=A0A1W0X5P6_HYPEX|nr:putative EF-hand calcium-binding domain-containing protein 1 [Hypsibius exemplaris]